MVGVSCGAQTSCRQTQINLIAEADTDTELETTQVETQQTRRKPPRLLGQFALYECSMQLHIEIAGGNLLARRRIDKKDL